MSPFSSEAANAGAYYEMHAYLCKALAHPTRLLIIDELRDGPRSVGELCLRLGLPQSNLSQHLGILRAKRLVSHRRDGSTVYYQVKDPRLIEAFDLLRSVLRDALHEEGRLAMSS
ncbi:MAG: ArsR/SmtB family transcription factor [Candidatus Dormibacteria bacterium]